MKLTQQASRLGGDPSAPIGTEGWAEFWRGQLRAALEMMFVEPGVVAGKIAVGNKYDAFKLLKDADGKPFTSFEDFCRAPRPYGLARDPVVVRSIIALAEGKTPNEVKLETVPAAQQGERTDLTSGTERTKSLRQTKALRAITRAPAAIRDLYRADLVGVKEAAMLGPKNPSPEEAAKVAAVAVEAKRIAAETKDKHQVNAYVREALGAETDSVRAALRAIGKVPTDRLAELAALLPAAIRAALQ